MERVGAPPHAEEGVKTFSKPRAGAAVEGSTFLSVILSDPERSEGESKDPYTNWLLATGNCIMSRWQ